MLYFSVTGLVTKCYKSLVANLLIKVYTWVYIKVVVLKIYNNI